jgi:hypothetical protein
MDDLENEVLRMAAGAARSKTFESKTMTPTETALAVVDAFLAAWERLARNFSSLSHI